MAKEIERKKVSSKSQSSDKKRGIGMFVAAGRGRVLWRKEKRIFMPDPVLDLYQKTGSPFMMHESENRKSVYSVDI